MRVGLRRDSRMFRDSSDEHTYVYVCVSVCERARARVCVTVCMLERKDRKIEKKEVCV